jgi:hypothetical protein
MIYYFVITKNYIIVCTLLYYISLVSSYTVQSVILFFNDIFPLSPKLFLKTLFLNFIQIKIDSCHTE